MSLFTELETRFHADAHQLDRDFPRADRLERGIMDRLAITARHERRTLTGLQEMALAGLVVVAVALLAVGIAQARALMKPAPVRTPPALSRGTSFSACPPQRGEWVNATTGWQGDSDRTDWYGLPLRTTDGGLHWKPVHVPVSGYGDVTKTGSTSCFLDADHAWVTINHLSGSLVIYRTTDGGHTWQSGDPVSGGVRQLIVRLAFLDAQRGWLFTDAQGMPGCAGRGVPNPSLRTIYTTTNGGLHWKQIVRACTGDGSTLGTLGTGCSESGLTLFDVNTAWLTWDCLQPSVSQAPVLDTINLPTPLGAIVASTRDGGRSWQRVALPSYPSSGQSACGAWPPVFTQTHGVLAISCQGAGHSAVFRTDDGGRSWRFLRPPSESAVTVDYFIDASRGWAFSPAAGSNPFAPNGHDLYRTTDGGSSWVVVKRGLFSGRAVVSLQFLDDSVGYAFTTDQSNGVDEVKTTDGGQTWAVVRTAPTG